MTDGTDFQGISVFIATIVNSGLLIYAVIRQSKGEKKADIRDKKLDEIKVLTNGQSKELQAIARIAGADEERKHPTEGPGLPPE